MPTYSLSMLDSAYDNDATPSKAPPLKASWTRCPESPELDEQAEYRVDTPLLEGIGDAFSAPIELKKAYHLERRCQRLLQKNPHLVAVSAALQSSQHYFSSAQKSQAMLMLNDDRFVFCKNTYLSPHGKYLYIVDLDGNMIVSNQQGIHHSYLANGEAVKAAGEVIFDCGKMVEIDNFSGHYKPTLIEMLDFLNALSKRLDPRAELTFRDYSYQVKREIHHYRLIDIKTQLEASHPLRTLQHTAIIESMDEHFTKLKTLKVERLKAQADLITTELEFSRLSESMNAYV